MEIKFKRDTAFRKQFFVPDSFAHPVKMDAQLLIWLVEHYSKEGETILDPMAGSGTTMLACGLGRNCILVELEEKFCKMMRDNWGEVKMRPQLGYSMGDCQIIQGDARQLGGLLVDKIISSPPFAESTHHSDDAKAQEQFRPGRTGTCAGTAGENPNNIGNLPYGNIDKCIFSPPYALTVQKGHEGVQAWKVMEGLKNADKETLRAKSKELAEQGIIHNQYGETEGNIGNLPYGEIDKIITSPPWEGTGFGQSNKNVGNVVNLNQQVVSRNRPANIAKGQKAHQIRYADQVEDNIGNLKSQSYLEAMLQVYQQCYRVLKPQGLMILVTKNFIRNKAVIRLDTDTIKLCEQAGFKFLERHYRKLPAQSFWRIIYQQKHPEVETIDFEDVLIFRNNKQGVA